MRYLSLCSGIEAASLAWAPLGWRPVLFSEVEAFPRAVLEQRWGARDLRYSGSGGVPLWGDMTALRPRHFARLGIETPDLIVAGTPCQAFSVAGLRKGLADDRGNLTLQFVRIVDAVDNLRCHRGEPQLLGCWENVPGVLSSRDNAFGCFLAALAGCDAALVPPGGAGWSDAGVVVGPRRALAWRCLDAQHFGLAQRRKRVFVVFGPRDWPVADALFPLGQGVRRDPETGAEKRENLAAPVASCPPGGSGADLNEAIPLLEIGARTSGDGYRDGDGLGAPGDPMFTLQSGHQHGVAHTVATTLRARDLARGGDSDCTDTLIAAPEIASTLTQGVESQGRGGYAGRRREDDHNLVAFNNTGQGWWNDAKDRAASVRDMSAGSGSAEATLVAHTLKRPSHGAAWRGDGSDNLVAAPLNAATKGRRPGCQPDDAESLVAVDLQNCALGGAVAGTLDTTRPTRGGGQAVMGIRVSPNCGAWETGEAIDTLNTNTDRTGHLVAYGGNNTAGPVDLATARNAHGGPHGRLDFESETFVIQNATRGKDQNGLGVSDEAIVPTLDQGSQHAVAFESRYARNGRGAPSGVVPPLKAQSGQSGKGDAAPLLATPMMVRRLTPVECERLQGFWDGYTAITFRGKDAADGPRYRSLGNSMAVPVMAYIGQQIARVAAVWNGSIPRGTAQEAPASAEPGDRSGSAARLRGRSLRGRCIGV